MANEPAQQSPIQAVERPIICNPFEEPGEHWHFDRESMEMQRVAGRRAAGYWYKTDQVGAAQRGLFADEQWDDLPLINLLRKDVRSLLTKSQAVPETAATKNEVCSRP